MNPELTEKAKRHLEDLLSFFEVNAPVVARGEGDTIELGVQTEEAGGRLIGHRGENLAAIQHILNMMMRRATSEKVYVRVDVGGYRQARLEKLEEKAREAAEQVRAEGVEVPLPMMSAAERRHIHSALADEPGITTESRGEGSHRRLVIRPE